MDLLESDILKPAIISTIIITNIVLNSTVIAVILRYPQLREDRTTLFMFSLTLSDLASGCTTMPISAAVCSKATPEVREAVPVLPMVHEICSSWFAFVSLHSLCWVTVCKMVAITKPLRYQQLFSRNRCFTVISLTWFAGALFSMSISCMAVTWDMAACFYDTANSSSYDSVPVLDVAIILSFVFFGWTVPVVTIMCATAIIYKSVSRAQRQIAAQIHSIGGIIGLDPPTSPLPLQTIRSGKNVLIICFTVFILSVPAAITLVLISVGRYNDMSHWVKFAIAWIFMSNYSANSLLYLLLFRSVRQKTKQLYSELYQYCSFCWINK